MLDSFMPPDHSPPANLQLSERKLVSFERSGALQSRVSSSLGPDVLMLTVQLGKLYGSMRLS